MEAFLSHYKEHPPTADSEVSRSAEHLNSLYQLSQACRHSRVHSERVFQAVIVCMTMLRIFKASPI